MEGAPTRKFRKTYKTLMLMQRLYYVDINISMCDLYHHSLLSYIIIEIISDLTSMIITKHVRNTQLKGWYRFTKSSLYLTIDVDSKYRSSEFKLI